jgi:hypothetical protein
LLAGVCRHTAGVAVGSVVSLASAPLASGVLERVVDGRALSRWWMLAANLGIVGSALLCASKLGQNTGSGASTVLGIGLGLVAGSTYAIYSWASHHLMNSGITRAASMGAVFGGGGLLLMPVLVVTGAPLLATPQAFAVGAYMALVPMFVGYLLFGTASPKSRRALPPRSPSPNPPSPPFSRCSSSANASGCWAGPASQSSRSCWSSSLSRQQTPTSRSPLQRPRQPP